MKKSALIGAVITVLSLGMVSMASALVARQFAGNVQTTIDTVGGGQTTQAVHHTATTYEGDDGGALTDLVLTPSVTARGAIRIDTTTAAWGVAVPAGSETWNITVASVDVNSAAFYDGSAWVPMKVGTTVNVRFVNSRTHLYVKLTAWSVDQQKLLRIRPLTYGASLGRVIQ